MWRRKSTGFCIKPAALARRLSRVSLITYEVDFTDRCHVDAVFVEAGLVPRIVLTIMDSDAIKQYLSLGMGVGIIASMAFEHGRDKGGLRAVEPSHLLASNVTRLAVRRGAHLRAYASFFIERFAPVVTCSDIERALQVEGADS